MAEIRRMGFVRHLRAEPSSFVLRYRNGRLLRSGQGLSFWFLPISCGVAEVPTEDREVSFLFHGRSADFQDVSAQGVITYRIAEATKLAARVDFTIDLGRGTFLRQPLDRIALILTQLAQQSAQVLIARTPVRELVREGYEAVRERVLAGLTGERELAEMGLQILSVRVASIKPTPDLEKALEAPTREAIQQQADEAAFARRALAVDKERAIQENELNNRIELARREAQLIEQEGANRRRTAEEAAAAERVAAEAKADRQRIEVAADAEKIRFTADAEAQRIRLSGAANAETVAQLGKARAEGLAAQMDAYRKVTPDTLLGLAAHELAGKLQSIGHLTVAPEILTPLLSRLLTAQVAKEQNAG